MALNIIIPKLFPTLQTERLKLVELHERQKQDLFNMRRDPKHHLYTDSLPDQSLEDTKDYIQKMVKGVREGKWLIWGIEINETGHIAGTISLWNFNEANRTGELGYGLIKTAQQKGYMKEALEAVIKFGFEVLELSEIQAFTEAENTKSIQLLEKLAFEHSDTIEESGYLVGKTYVMRIYTLNNK